MSKNKLLNSNCFCPCNVFDNHIYLNFNHICADILKNINCQLFVDDKLNHDQCMYLLDHCTSIDGSFLNVLFDFIHNLTLDNDIRQFYINNMNRFSFDLIHVHYYTPINIRNLIISDDSDSYVDDFIDDLNLTDDGNDDGSDDDDLENILMDEYEMQLDTIIVYRNTNSDSDLDDGYD